MTLSHVSKIKRIMCIMQTMEYIAQDLPKAGDTVLVGLSGGVDSTLTALMLKNAGCKVIGVTMSLWDGTVIEKNKDSNRIRMKEACFGPAEAENIRQCQEFCRQNGIEYHVVDVKPVYKEKVIEYFKAEYRSGRTPNPCVMCNQNVKFGAMLDAVSALGISYDYFCTGHYARIVQPAEGVFGTDVRPFMISTATDSTKDQTYFLYNMTAEIAERLIFPLEEFESKDRVRQVAAEHGMAVATKPDSEDACFIPDGDYKKFLEENSDIKPMPGDAVLTDGTIIGRHEGLYRYTIGQRKGLGIAYKRPIYVVGFDADANRLIMGAESDLYSDKFTAENVNWILKNPPTEAFKCKVKTRFSPREYDCTVDPGGAECRVVFDRPQKSVTPGQSAVFYDGDICLGGGVIK